MAKKTRERCTFFRDEQRARDFIDVYHFGSQRHRVEERRTAKNRVIWAVCVKPKAKKKGH